MNLRSLFLLTLCGVLFLTSLQAQEWPRFRGPNGSGLAEGMSIPATWTEDEVLWKIDLPGIGNGSMAIAGDRIFLLCADPETSQRFPVCVSTKDGSILWQKSYQTDKFKGHRFNTPASSTPAVDEEHVYYAWGTKERLTVTAFTHAGEEVWSADLGPVNGGHGFGASPIVHGDLLVLNNDQEGVGTGSLIAVHKATGEKAWEIPRKGTRLSYSTPCVYQGNLIFTNWRHGFTAVEPETGKVLSDVSVFSQEQNERAISSPVVAGDLVIGTCGFTSNPKHCVAMKMVDGELQEIWRTERNVPHIPSVIVVGNRAFLWDDSGIGTCINAETGEVIWRERIGGNFFGSPVTDGTRILNVDVDGAVVTIAASDEYEELGRVELGEVVRNTPALAHGNLYVRTLERLIAVRGE